MAGFVYTFRTSAGQRQTGEIEAPSRDAAFAELRAQGIRPIKVVAKDGTKANGEVRGVRKRVVTVCVISVAVLAGILAFFVGRTTTRQQQGDPLSSAEAKASRILAQPLERQRIPGDRARIENFPRNLFGSDVERYLALFAEPGRPVSRGELSSFKVSSGDLESSLKSPIRFSSSDFTEYVDLMRIVEGMKREMRAYLSGGGSVEQYLAELSKRQEMEIAHREKAEKRVSELLRTPKEAYEYWLKANAQLKSMGIYEIPLPDELRSYQMSVDIDE